MTGELVTQAPIEEQIQNDLGIKVPEFMSYPPQHPMAGTKFEVTSYDRDAKAFDLAGHIQDRGRSYEHIINYVFLPDVNVLARRDRPNPQRRNQEVSVRYTDRNFRLEYCLTEATSEKDANGRFISGSTRSFFSDITYEQHPEEPDHFRWGGSLRNELARLFSGDQEDSLIVSYPAYYTLEEYLELLRNGRDHSATDSLKVSTPFRAVLKYLQEDQFAFYGYVEKSMLLEPGVVYETDDSRYYQIRMTVSDKQVKLEKLDFRQGPGSRIVIPNPASLDFLTLLEMGHGEKDEWINLRDLAPFRLEMFGTGLPSGNGIKLLEEVAK